MCKINHWGVKLSHAAQTAFAPHAWEEPAEMGFVLGYGLTPVRCDSVDELQMDVGLFLSTVCH